MQIVTLPARDRPGRIGFVVGRKVLPRAVDRNRFKRVLREFLRAASADIAAFDVVIRVKRPVSRDAVDVAASEAVALVRKAIDKPLTAAAPR